MDSEVIEIIEEIFKDFGIKVDNKRVKRRVMKIKCPVCGKQFDHASLYELPDGSECCAGCLNTKLIDADMLAPFLGLGNFLKEF